MSETAAPAAQDSPERSRSPGLGSTPAWPGSSQQHAVERTFTVEHVSAQASRHGQPGLQQQPRTPGDLLQQHNGERLASRPGQPQELMQDAQSAGATAAGAAAAAPLQPLPLDRAGPSSGDGTRLSFGSRQQPLKEQAQAEATGVAPAGTGGGATPEASDQQVATENAKGDNDPHLPLLPARRQPPAQSQPELEAAAFSPAAAEQSPPRQQAGRPTRPAAQRRRAVALNDHHALLAIAESEAAAMEEAEIYVPPLSRVSLKIICFSC